MSHPIPDAALDDRHAFVGTSGSGKTYNAGTAVERLLAAGARVGIVDPLGVWWGLRLLADGKTASGYDVVIFGGPHGDLPLTENAGALIGETCASMAESFILDLSQLGTKASERRFMLAFLTALHRKTAGEPLNLVVDEADMFAPQFVSDKDGEATKLLGMMETIVRRGRIKGFIPWLITQRPAVLNKNVLSQADGLIAMKLTSSQDRAALGDWIEGQADRAEGRRILAEMPTLQLGQGVVWIPGRSILQTAKFPRKRTFDSSRTPKRGETKRTLTLKPIDLGALKDKLAKVESEVAASDPRKLQAKVAELERQLRAGAASPEALAKARAEGRKEGYDEGYSEGHAIGFQKGGRTGYVDGMRRGVEALRILEKEIPDLPATNIRIPAPAIKATPSAAHDSPPRAKPSRASPVAMEGLTKPQARVLEALAFWRDIGIDPASRVQLGAAAGYSPSSGGFNNLLGGLKTAGLIDYPTQGFVTLTDEGAGVAPQSSGGSVRERLGAILSAPQAKIIDALADGDPMSRDDLGAATDYSPTSGGFNNLLGSLRSLGLIDYPTKGQVRVEPWVFELTHA